MSHAQQGARAFDFTVALFDLMPAPWQALSADCCPLVPLRITNWKITLVTQLQASTDWLIGLWQAEPAAWQQESPPE